jgi:small subunit ribosomal protein S9
VIKNLSNGTGRRKTAVARVYLREGSGEITVNGKNVTDYFNNPTFDFVVRQPLAVTDNEGKFDIYINVKGGGPSGQAGACRHGVSRALTEYDAGNIKVLRANGFLTRDPRMVERKKYGQPGARKKFQFSKR